MDGMIGGQPYPSAFALMLGASARQGCSQAQPPLEEIE
jgi:hypothetical protein